MARKHRERRRQSSRRPEARVHDEILGLADRLGIGSDYRRIPDSAKAGMYSRPCLPPVVTLDSTTRDDPAARAAAEGMRGRLNQTELELAQFGNARVPLRSVYSALAHLDSFLRGFAEEHPGHEPAARCRQVVEEVLRQVIPAAGSALEMLTLAQLMPYQRFDTKLYGVRLLHPARGATRLRMEIQLFSEPARRTSLDFEGVPRPAFQCGGFLRPGVIDWVAWKPADVQVPGPDRLCTVHVQSHAIRQFYERLVMPPSLNEPTVVMFQSLMRPNVVTRNPDGSLLIECRSAAGRLGYFVARFLSEEFLVNTFLFLTMKGTPEAARIYERLRVGRHAVEMMKLDDLSTYLLSDVREDPDLVKLLSDCGCGHQFAMAGQMPFKVPALMRQARDLRRILGWAASDSEAGEPDLQEPGDEELEQAASAAIELLEGAHAPLGLLDRMRSLWRSLGSP